MKRLLSVCLLLLFVLAQSAFAETWKRYTVAPNATIDIPPDFPTFHKSLSQDDPVFKEFGITKEIMLQILEEDDLTLASIYDNYEKELAISCTEDTYGINFSELGKFQIKVLADEIGKQYEELGHEYLGGEAYVSPNANFCKTSMLFHEYGESYYRVCYSTFEGGYSITIRFSTQSESFTEQEEALIESIVDTFFILKI